MMNDIKKCYYHDKPLLDVYQLKKDIPKIETKIDEENLLIKKYGYSFSIDDYFNHLKEIKHYCKEYSYFICKSNGIGLNISIDILGNLRNPLSKKFICFYFIPHQLEDYTIIFEVYFFTNDCINLAKRDEDNYCYLDRKELKKLIEMNKMFNFKINKTNIKIL